MSDKRTLLVSENQTALFRMYKDYRIVGNEIKEDFFGLKKAMEIKDGRFIFHMNETSTKEGLLSQAYGLFLLSSITDRFGVTFDADTTDRYEKTVLALVDYINRHGFDVSPFSTPEQNAKFFGADGDAFIESVTWTLSCLLYTYRLQKSNKIDLGGAMAGVVALIAKSLKLLVDNVIRTDDKLGYGTNATAECKFGYCEGAADYRGWGPVTGCSQVSLYFTHSVCETFGDLEDTALGNEELDIRRDEEFISQINAEAGDDVVDKFKTICECAGANLYNKYKDKLGKAYFYADGSEAKTSQIACSIQSPVLLNQLYVVLGAIYTNYYTRFPEESEAYKEFMTTAKSAVDMVYQTYIDLKKAGQNSIVDRDVVMFSERHTNKNLGKYLAGERINVSILEALIVKAKNMIVTYVSKYPEKEIDTVIDVLEDNHMADKWIWNENGFDLQQTERCISAIREFYDYYIGYVYKYAKSETEESVVIQQHVKEIKTLEDSLSEERKRHAEIVDDLKRAAHDTLEAEKEQHAQEIARIRRENEETLARKVKEAKESNFLDSAVLGLIDSRLEERMTVILSGLFKKILQNSIDLTAQEYKLTKEQTEFKDAVKQLMFSYLMPSAYEVLNNRSLNGEWYVQNILRGVEKDFSSFLVEWMDYITSQNKNEDVNGNNFKGLLQMLEEKTERRK